MRQRPPRPHTQPGPLPGRLSPARTAAVATGRRPPRTGRRRRPSPRVRDRRASREGRPRQRERDDERAPPVSPAAGRPAGRKSRVRAGVGGHEDTLRRNRLTAVGCRPPPGLDALSIVSERLVAAVPANRPRAPLSRVTLADISAHPMVCMPTGTGIRTVFDRARAAKGLRPTVALQASAPAAVADRCPRSRRRHPLRIHDCQVRRHVDRPRHRGCRYPCGARSDLEDDDEPPFCKLLRHCRHARDDGATQAHASSPRGARQRPRSIARPGRHHVRRRPSGTPGDASRGRTTARGGSRRIAPTSRNNRAKTPKGRHLRRGRWRPLWQRSPRLRRSQQWRWRGSNLLGPVGSCWLRALTCSDGRVFVMGGALSAASALTLSTVGSSRRSVSTPACWG